MTVAPFQKITFEHIFNLPTQTAITTALGFLYITEYMQRNKEKALKVFEEKVIGAKDNAIDNAIRKKILLGFISSDVFLNCLNEYPQLGISIFSGIAKAMVGEDTKEGKKLVEFLIDNPRLDNMFSGHLGLNHPKTTNLYTLGLLLGTLHPNDRAEVFIKMSEKIQIAKHYTSHSLAHENRFSKNLAMDEAIAAALPKHGGIVCKDFVMAAVGDQRPQYYQPALIFNAAAQGVEPRIYAHMPNRILDERNMGEFAKSENMILDMRPKEYWRMVGLMRAFKEALIEGNLPLITETIMREWHLLSLLGAVKF